MKSKFLLWSIIGILALIMLTGCISNSQTSVAVPQDTEQPVPTQLPQ